MTSKDVKITIDSNLDNDQSSQQIMIQAFNSQSEIMETSESDSSSTSERTSKEEKQRLVVEKQMLDDIKRLDEMHRLVHERQMLDDIKRVDELHMLVDEKQMLDDIKRLDELHMLVDEKQRLIDGEERWSIPKVPYRLREEKQKAYEPNAISIGPYHYGKKHLMAMDEVKRSSFANIVGETKHELNIFVDYMKPLKERALKCYEGPIHADLVCDDKFIEMMVFDGCFIVQIIRHMYPPELDKLPRHIQNDMWDDLLLVENQLPLFVLLELDQIIMGSNGGGLVKFQNAAISSFLELDAYTLRIFSESSCEQNSQDDIKHLLDMVHKCYLPSPRGIEKHKKYSKTKESKGLIRSGKFILSASELDNAGIDFVGVEGKSLFDVAFRKFTHILTLKIRKKVLKIPTIYVNKNTERRLRNLMAYELFTPIWKPTYVSDYVVLMGNLIDTSKDVHLLCSSGVIENRLVDYEAVAQMFNELGDSTYSRQDFYYAEIVDKVNRHCKENTHLAKWNKSIAKLKKDYFSSPWSVVSFLAAVVLLVATLIQTVFTVTSGRKHA